MTNRFIDNGNHTISDALTGLMWQESYAYVETGNNISWYDAQGYIEKLNNLKLGGYCDWRLPERLEIQSLYEIALPFQSRALWSWFYTSHHDQLSHDFRAKRRLV